jgi:hypothetical protein
MISPLKPEYAEPGLESFRGNDRLARLQRHLAWLAPLAIIGGLALISGLRKTWDQRYSPHPLATVHVLWKDRCEVCHATSHSIGANNWLGRMIGDTHVSDAQCSRCHQGPEHHHAEKPEEVAACTACHVEHRGENTSLVRVPDQQCTRCHGNLSAHTARHPDAADPRPEYVAHQSSHTAFDGYLTHHPGFFPVDPGKLKFNHKLHMTEGIRKLTTQAKFRLQDIAEEQREQYVQAAGPNTAVQLRCEACHQIDPGTPNPRVAPPPRVPVHAVQPVRPAGAYMMPITYELHCQACHPLTIGHKDYIILQVPHRLPLAEVRDYLEGYYAPRYLKKQAELGKEEQPRPLPGRPPQAMGQLQALEEAIQNPIARAEQELYETRKGCVLCHYLTQAPQANMLRARSPRQIMPTRVPTVWLQKASFNHASHRLLECRSCHPRAFANATDAPDSLPNPQASEKSEDVLLPAIDTCFSCHNMRGRASARSDCVECHRYHNGDLPREGKGATRRGPPHPVSLKEFLTGPKPLER